MKGIRRTIYVVYQFITSGNSYVLKQINPYSYNVLKNKVRFPDQVDWT
jgi:hypothetical protein